MCHRDFISGSSVGIPDLIGKMVFDERVGRRVKHCDAWDPDEVYTTFEAMGAV